MKLSDLVQPVDLSSVDFTSRSVLVSDVLSHLLYLQEQGGCRKVRDDYRTVASLLYGIAGVSPPIFKKTGTCSVVK